MDSVLSEQLNIDQMLSSRADLSSDPLLRHLPRMTLQGITLPEVSGIPLLRRIGSGGMGAVYSAYHLRLDKPVAIKILPPGLAELHPGMVKRFLREAQLAAKIRCDNLVAVLDVNEHNRVCYLILEYVHGISAQGLLEELRLSKRTGLSESDALKLCTAACIGLSSAHKQGIIHRDIKPGNILIPYSETGIELDFAKAKLADLGLARIEDSAADLTSHAALGTPGFMAPEQFEEAAKVKKQADVFGMGATFYALLTGRAPFAASSFPEAMLRTINEPFVPIEKNRDDISDRSIHVINRCLAKHQTERYADADALLGALAQVAVMLPSHLVTLASRPKSSGEISTIVGRPVKPSPPIPDTLPPITTDTSTPPAITSMPDIQSVDKLPSRWLTTKQDLQGKHEPTRRSNKRNISKAAIVLSLTGVTALIFYAFWFSKQLEATEKARTAQKQLENDSRKALAESTERALISLSSADSDVSAVIFEINRVLDKTESIPTIEMEHIHLKSIRDELMQRQSVLTQRCNRYIKLLESARMNLHFRDDLAAAVEALDRAEIEGQPNPEAKLPSLLEIREGHLHWADLAIEVRDIKQAKIKEILIQSSQLALRNPNEAKEQLLAAEALERIRTNTEMSESWSIEFNQQVKLVRDRIEQTERERDAVARISEALVSARKHKNSGEWDQVKRLLGPILNQQDLQDSDLVAEARQLLNEAESIRQNGKPEAEASNVKSGEEDRVSDFWKRVRLGSDNLATGKSLDFERELHEAKSLWPNVTAESIGEAGRVLKIASLLRTARQFETRGMWSDAIPRFNEIAVLDPHNEEAIKGIERYKLLELEVLERKKLEQAANLERKKIEQAAKWVEIVRSQFKGVDSKTLPEAKRQTLQSTLKEALAFDPKRKDEIRKVYASLGWNQWDGTESVENYGKRVGLPSTLSIPIGKGILLDLVLVPSGRFNMGSPRGEQGREGEEVQHEVVICKPFYLGKYEVTQEQYESVMGANPSYWNADKGGGPRNPVDKVTWVQAKEFCGKLPGAARLPTEAEWEYACRAGSSSCYSKGNTDDHLKTVAWFKVNTEKTNPSGSKDSNRFGLYDMHGNVCEWCEDWYDKAYYENSPQFDPPGPAKGQGKNYRGGNYTSSSVWCRSAQRNKYDPNSGDDELGFRILVSVSGDPEPK